MSSTLLYLAVEEALAITRRRAEASSTPDTHTSALDAHRLAALRSIRPTPAIHRPRTQAEPPRGAPQHHIFPSPPQSRLRASDLPNTPSRPNVPAPDRLLQWVPPNRDTQSTPSTRVQAVLLASWAPNTRSSYASALLHWYAWAATRVLPTQEQFHIPADRLVQFIADSAGAYAGTTISGWVSALRAYHILHGSSLDTKNTHVVQALRGADRLTPPSSKKPPRPPYTADMLARLKPAFNLADPFDAAVWALLLTEFWGLARLGELTVPSIPEFDPRYHPQRRALLFDGAPPHTTAQITLPWAKPDSDGQTIPVSPQYEPLNPISALRADLRLNPAPHTAHVFAHGPAFTPMTRSAFTQRVHTAAITTQQPHLPDHSLRIGGTTELLLRHKPLDAVRIAGRWKSDAWQRYIRRHVEIVAPALAFSLPHRGSALARIGRLDRLEDHPQQAAAAFGLGP
ncbi:hypothetical protein V8E36_001217 [Tilletia maclaganii]